MANSIGRNFPIQLMQCVFALLCGTCFLLSSCGSSTKSVELAQQQVEQFHSQLDSEHFTGLYAASDEKLRQASSESDFVKLLDAVHRKLGNVQQSNLRNTRVAWFAGQGATVTLVYETKFAQGTGMERFVWHIKNNGAALYGYHINSNELVTR
jgi:Protein of unknown function (DUF4019)